VAQGHNAEAWAFSPYATFRALVATGVELIAAAFVVIGIGAGVAYLASLITSQQAVFGLPASAVSTMRSSSYWLALHSTAANCQQTGAWETASDMILMLGALVGWWE
jgi:hypothetical protein